MRDQGFVTFPLAELAHQALVCILRNAIRCASIFWSMLACAYSTVCYWGPCSFPICYIL